MKLRAIGARCALLAGLTGFLVSDAIAADWLSNYGAAYRAAQKESKPLLVVLEKPTETRFRLEQVSASSRMSDSALLIPYKLCRIDVTTAHGKQIAELFGATEYPQIAITDNRADQIIHRQTGKLSDLDWSTMLVTYREGTRPAINFSTFRSSSSRACFT